MQTLNYQFSLASSTFAHGAYQTQNFNRPEVRPPAIKGMIRWWHQALGYSKEDAQELFGQVASRKEGTRENRASRVTIRLTHLTQPTTRRSEFMPHKGQRGGAKSALVPGTAYQLDLGARRGPLSPTLFAQLQRATEAWLVLGAIGQRSNRAAGSIQWDSAPDSQQDFNAAATQLLEGSKIRFALLPGTFEDEYQARSIAGDFLAAQAFGGTAPFGDARPRKPSPLKLKTVPLDESIRLLAIWDRRVESPDNLKRGVQTLLNSNKEIGKLLNEALPQLTA